MTYGCVTRGFACSLQLFPGCVNATGRDMETSGNGSTCSHVCANYKSSLGDTGDFLVGSVILFVIVSAVMLNTFVICSFAARWKSITITDYYILTLAVSDLCSPLFAYPMAMMSTFSHGWLFGETGCTINGFLGFFFGIADIFTLSLLSFSRFLCVCCPTSGEHHPDIKWRHPGAWGEIQLRSLVPCRHPHSEIYIPATLIFSREFPSISALHPLHSLHPLHPMLTLHVEDGGNVLSTVTVKVSESGLGEEGY
ncbi:hypothetical protein C0Q70_08491 [Pomacea canaliculata]|uniref:G-protein coupled receptors family 1 profile domain-containing protein n=1 Tax=Pomacea canaliculata TaxID=400727 RepID=A0A2T7PHZ8_POMCA|nr:hypothetical protein C0Q70_08491 [Pomacea canaliculata]